MIAQFFYRLSSSQALSHPWIDVFRELNVVLGINDINLDIDQDLDIDLSPDRLENFGNQALVDLLDEDGDDIFRETGSLKSASSRYSLVMLPSMSFMGSSKVDKRFGSKKSNLSSTYDDSSLSSGSTPNTMRRTFYKVVLAALNTVGVGVGAYKSKAVVGNIAICP